jgi:hypothetical protein
LERDREAVPSRREHMAATAVGGDAHDLVVEREGVTHLAPGGLP